MAAYTLLHLKEGLRSCVSHNSDLIEAFGDLELSGFFLWQYIKDRLATSSVQFCNSNFTRNWSAFKPVSVVT